MARNNYNAVLSNPQLFAKVYNAIINGKLSDDAKQKLYPVLPTLGTSQLNAILMAMPEINAADSCSKTDDYVINSPEDLLAQAEFERKQRLAREAIALREAKRNEELEKMAYDNLLNKGIKPFTKDKNGKRRSNPKFGKAFDAEFQALKDAKYVWSSDGSQYHTPSMEDKAENLSPAELSAKVEAEHQDFLNKSTAFIKKNAKLEALYTDGKHEVYIDRMPTTYGNQPDKEHVYVKDVRNGKEARFAWTLGKEEDYPLGPGEDSRWEIHRMREKVLQKMCENNDVFPDNVDLNTAVELLVKMQTPFSVWTLRTVEDDGWGRKTYRNAFYFSESDFVGELKRRCEKAEDDARKREVYDLIVNAGYDPDDVLGHETFNDQTGKHETENNERHTEDEAINNLLNCKS